MEYLTTSEALKALRKEARDSGCVFKKMRLNFGGVQAWGAYNDFGERVSEAATLRGHRDNLMNGVQLIHA